jgi:hypothetical protein
MAIAKTSNISPLDSTAATPFYRQIYDRLRGAITAGVLKPGDRIPSARALTKELGLARGTIEAAYSLLAAEGYIQARGYDTSDQERYCRGEFSPRIDFAVSNGFACPGSVSAKDLGTAGRAVCPGHAAIRHDSSVCLWLAGPARRDRRLSPGLTWD